MAKKNSKLSLFEIIWYSIMGAIALGGLTLIVLGVIARNLRSSEELYKANASFAAAMKMGYVTFGIILLVVGVIAAVIVLLVNAKKSDREVEKEQRRAARLASASETKTEDTVTE